MALADELDWRKINIDQLRILVEGGALTQENKYQNMTRVTKLDLYIMLSNHVNNNDVTKKFACSLCRRTYTWRKSLHKHWKLKHGGCECGICYGQDFR